jgi:hypothetical protein
VVECAAGANLGLDWVLGTAEHEGSVNKGGGSGMKRKGKLRYGERSWI